MGMDRSRALLAENVADAALDAVVKLACLVRGVTGTKTAQDEEHRDDDTTEDNDLTEGGAGLAELCPLHAASAEGLLHFLTAELVVDEATERNAVTKSLEKGDGVTEKEHGRKDEEDVLQNTGKGEDEGRGLANLHHC